MCTVIVVHRDKCVVFLIHVIIFNSSCHSFLLYAKWHFILTVEERLLKVHFSTSLFFQSIPNHTAVATH